MKSPHLNPVWLRQKYEVEGLSTYEIAALVGRDPKRIYEKLRDFGIPTRARGHNLRGKDNSWAQPGYVPHWTGRQHTAASKAKIAEKARGPKPWLRGERNGMYGATGAANPRYVDGSSPERQRLYASAEWKALLRQVYERDAYTCRRCAAGKKGPRSLHAHHVVPWAGERGAAARPGQHGHALPGVPRVGAQQRERRSGVAGSQQPQPLKLAEHVGALFV